MNVLTNWQVVVIPDRIVPTSVEIVRHRRSGKGANKGEGLGK